MAMAMVLAKAQVLALREKYIDAICHVAISADFWGRGYEGVRDGYEGVRSGYKGVREGYGDVRAGYGPLWPVGPTIPANSTTGTIRVRAQKVPANAGATSDNIIIDSYLPNPIPRRRESEFLRHRRRNSGVIPYSYGGIRRYSNGMGVGIALVRRVGVTRWA
jgi:hypothetical protein